VLARPPTYGAIQGRTCRGEREKPDRALPSERSRDEGRPALELLVEAPTEQLDELVAQLKGNQPAAELCDAMMKLIALAPLSQFLMLLEIYRRHGAPARS